MSLTAMVLLDRAFISLASDPTQYVAVGTAGSVGGGGTRTDTISTEGAFRNYANFVTRLILGTAKTRIEAVVLRALTPAQVAIIRGFAGQTVLFRDTYGRKIWGSYLVTAETDIPLSGKANDDLMTDVAITFQQITYTEGV